jgi:hypothetical protein
MTTYAGIAQLLADIRMLTPEQVRDHLDDHEELDEEDIPSALEDMGVAIAVHGGDVDDLEESYRYLLEQAGNCSGGAVEITGVRLADGELHFVRNGKPLSWHVEHQSDEYLDHLSVYEFIHLLAPDDERTFHALPQRESGDASVYVLATTVQAQVLTDVLGLQFD